MLVLSLSLIYAGWAGLRQEHNMSKTQQLKAEILLIINQKGTDESVHLIGETTGVFKQRYNLVFTKEKPTAALGTYIKVTGKAEPIESPRNKYLFNYENYAYSISAFHQMFNPKVKMIDKTSFRQYIYYWKNKLQQYIDRTYRHETKPLLQALLLGDSVELKEKYQTFVELGLLQIFTLSARYLKKLQIIFLRVSSYFKIPEMIGTIIILGFTYASSIFLWKNMALKQFFLSSMLHHLHNLCPQKKMAAIQRLSLSGLILVASNPYVIFNFGFIFVFILRFGLIAGSHYFKCLKAYQKGLIFPLFIFFLMLPITLYLQQSISLIQILFYIILSPLGLMFFLASILVLIFPQFEVVFNYFQLIMLWLNDVLLSRYANCSLLISWLFWLQSCCLYVLYFWLLRPKRWVKRLRKILIIVCFIGVTHYVNASLNSIHFLSLPNGEITIIKEQNTIYLIDIGGNHKENDNIYQTERFIIPFLHHLHIDRVHHVILTHDDLDHVGDFSFFVENFLVDNVYYNQSSLPFKDFKSKNPQIQYHQVDRLMEVGSLHLFAVYSAQDSVNSNNLSLISYGVFGGKKWLFMGDLEQEGERKLLQMYRALKIDVLKVGHHGSKTSSSAVFLRKLMPQYAIITVQKRNRHGHPHPEVVKRLKEHEITYYNTNEIGSIHFFFWGNQGVFVIE